MRVCNAGGVNGKAASSLIRYAEERLLVSLQPYGWLLETKMSFNWIEMSNFELTSFKYLIEVLDKVLKYQMRY